ncbi:50S ribosomal protein L6 [Pyruvatibacter sp.]|uniref:50S ribosomal protein L6 n=1 Tax=unclassified Pyruvatibacter TaxID=2618840 RepID=UPI0029687223|nr:50S ribosomal protein L6 [Alphaproteobacteria bacterium]
MSRIGKMPIAIASGVTVTVDGRTVKAKGSKGELELTLVPEVTVSQGEDGLTVAPVDDSQRARAMWGLSRSLVANMVQGVAEGFSKELEINGVGYRAEVQGKSLKLALGFSHDVIYPVPEGIEIKTPKPTEVVISGIDKQKVGQVAAEIRSYRPPEPYKGKGVKYVDEYIFRKEGKKK